jgi:hypothetical protein
LQRYKEKRPLRTDREWNKPERTGLEKWDFGEMTPCGIGPTPRKDAVAEKKGTKEG